MAMHDHLCRDMTQPTLPSMQSVISTVPIGRRIEQRLAELNQTQVWLATNAGVEPSTVSRIIKGERNPTLDTVENFAPVLGMKLAELVHGTDAEARLHEASRLVPRALFDEEVQKVAEGNGKLFELEQHLRQAKDQLGREQQRRETAERERCEIQISLDRAADDRQEAQKQIRELSLALREHRQALHLAVGEVSALRQQLTELADAVTENGKTARMTALLAGIAALTGGVTVAHFLHRADASAKSGPEAGNTKEHRTQARKRT